MLVRPILIASLLVLGLVATLPAQAASATSLSTAPTLNTAAAIADQAAICVVGDVYNTGSLPCAGLVCYGQSQYAWQTCVGNPICLPPRCHIPPPEAGAQQNQVALCVYGDAYNTGGSRCEGAVCVGWTMGDWVDCYPRFPPCWACPPPPPMRRM